MHTELRDKSQESLVIDTWRPSSFWQFCGGPRWWGPQKKANLWLCVPSTNTAPSLIPGVSSTLAHYNPFITRDNVTNWKENQLKSPFIFPSSGVNSIWPIWYHIWWRLSIYHLLIRSGFSTFDIKMCFLTFILQVTTDLRLHTTAAYNPNK